MSFFFQRGSRIPASSIALVSIGILSFSKHAFTSALNDKSTNERQRENLHVYLKEESRDMVRKFLEERGIHDRVPSSVCFVRDATAMQRYTFRPLYGQRAAFRLKGLIETANGQLVGVGRLSTMVGALQDGDYEASMPLYKVALAKTEISASSNGASGPSEGEVAAMSKADISSSSNLGLSQRAHSTAGFSQMVINITEDEMHSMMDLPTRVQRIRAGLRHSGMWKGRLPAGLVFNPDSPSFLCYPPPGREWSNVHANPAEKAIDCGGVHLQRPLRGC